MGVLAAVSSQEKSTNPIYAQVLGDEGVTISIRALHVPSSQMYEKRT